VTCNEEDTRMQDTNQLLISLILYGILPLWGISGFVDWLCHRTSRIETTSGLKESLIHSVMGIQLGVPIVLGLVFQVNVLILLICAVVWMAHVLVAHWDVHYSAPLRRISIWEVHAHNYMATIPLFLFSLIVVINWDIALKLVTLDWSGQFELVPTESRQLTPAYRRAYLSFMALFCVLPYLEENIRCLRAARGTRT
jgi:hypothetical protein